MENDNHALNKMKQIWNKKSELATFNLNHNIMAQEHEYPFLYFISRWYKISAYIIAVCAVLMPIMLIAYRSKIDITGDFGGIIILMSLGAFIILGTIAITNFAISEAIILFIDIEENTNQTANYLSKILLFNKKEDSK